MSNRHHVSVSARLLGDIFTRKPGDKVLRVLNERCDRVALEDTSAVSLVLYSHLGFALTLIDLPSCFGKLNVIKMYVCILDLIPTTHSFSA